MGIDFMAMYTWYFHGCECIRSTYICAGICDVFHVCNPGPADLVGTIMLYNDTGASFMRFITTIDIQCMQSLWNFSKSIGKNS